MFRYSDKPIFGKLKTFPTMEAVNPNNATANRTDFIRMQSKLLNHLILQAARGDSKRKYAQGDGPAPPPYTRFYATTQCTPDLSHKDCNRCLLYGLQNATEGRIGIRWFCPSCNFQIESDLRFFLLDFEYEPDGPDRSTITGKIYLTDYYFNYIKKQTTEYYASVTLLHLKNRVVCIRYQEFLGSNSFFFLWAGISKTKSIIATVGSVVGLVIIIICIYFLLTRDRRKEKQSLEGGVLVKMKYLGAIIFYESFI